MGLITLVWMKEATGHALRTFLSSTKKAAQGPLKRIVIGNEALDMVRVGSAVFIGSSSLVSFARTLPLAPSLLLFFCLLLASCTFR